MKMRRSKRRVAGIALMLLTSTLTLNRQALAEVDSRLLATWTVEIPAAEGIWKLSFRPESSGSYRTSFSGPTDIPDETGRLDAIDGQWSVIKASGERDGGSYAFNSDGSVTFTGKTGQPIVWQRIGAVAQAPQGGQTDAAQAAANRDDPAEGERLFEQGKALYLRKDFAHAAEFFLKGAELGDARSQLQIGSQFERGEGVRVDNREAVMWYRRSAEQGNSIAQKNLGQMYELGQGVREDWMEAARWYRASALQGDVNGQSAYSRAFQFGIGVAQNRAEALAWLRKAAAQGDGEAQHFLRHLQDPTNFIGFRNEAERQAVLGNKLRFGLIGEEPVGMLFRNSAERNAYIMGARNRVDLHEAHVWWEIRKNEYDECQRSHSGYCADPGPEPK